MYFQSYGRLVFHNFRGAGNRFSFGKSRGLTLVNPFNSVIPSGCRESNPAYMHPMHAYCRYTTPRFYKIYYGIFSVKIPPYFTTPYQFSFSFFWQSWQSDGLRRGREAKHFLTPPPILERFSLLQAEKSACHSAVLICQASEF